MAEVAAPPDLHDRLDSLWTSYLQYLDAYSTAQKLLQKHMSAGYLSMARANFNTRDGVTRYGKDFYHDRAVATRRAAITTDSDGKTKAELMTWRAMDEEPNLEDDEKFDAKKAKQQPSPPATPELAPEGDAAGSKAAEHTDSEAKSSASKNKPPLTSDPLRWFGILTPRELRSAQTSFCAAADEAMVDAVNAARSMRESESEIRKLRKEIKKNERL